MALPSALLAYLSPFYNEIVIISVSNKVMNPSHKSLFDVAQYTRVSNRPINPFVPTVPTFAVRETASLGMMGEPRMPPLNPSETIVL